MTGYFTGEWLKHQPIKSCTSLNLIISGLSCLVIWYLWGLFFPINKVLWTSSYVIFTAGWALLFLATCHQAIDVRAWHKWRHPSEVMGLNAILMKYLNNDEKQKKYCSGKSKSHTFKNQIIIISKDEKIVDVAVIERGPESEINSPTKTTKKV